MSESPTAAEPSLAASILRGWDSFWFSRMDPTTLAFIRFWCGLLTFYVHLTYSWGLFSYVGPEAWVNHDLAGYILRDVPQYSLSGGWDESFREVARGNYYWSIYYHVTDPTWIVAIHVTFLVSMLLFSVGFATRFTGALSWLGAMSYVQRANSTVFGLDTMMLILLLYLQIGPAGATLSVDRLLRKWWARRNGLPVPPVEPSYAANFAVRLMQVHFCVVYLASGTSKLLGSTWWSGTALNMVLLNSSFAPMSSAPYFYAMKTLAQHRWLWEAVMAAGIVYSILLEVSFSFLVWDRRWRWVMICGSVMLHLGIGIFMGLTTFSLMMIIFVSSFVPPEVIAQAAERGQALLDRMIRPKPAAPKGELVLSR